jgi:2-polyprenyl-3-methyl-5-hydroxy-6-metoxy-1,4-benzoquinol methylase
VSLFIANGSETQPVCALCGHNAGKVRYRYADYQIISCQRCGLWRSCPRLSADELNRYYEQEYYSEQRAREGKYQAWRDAHLDVWRKNAEMVRDAAKRMLGLAPQQVRLLDVGAGHGFFLEQCVALGMPARGIEPSEHAVRYAREELKLDVRAMTPEMLDPEERYHAITLWEVLEHVPDPLRTLEGLRAHLEPGGSLWVAVPNVNALQRFLQRGRYFNFLNKSHLTHFDRRSLRKMLRRAGFTETRRVIHFGGGGRRGIGVLAQYAARVLCLGTDIRFVAREQVTNSNEGEARHVEGTPVSER